MYSGKRDKTMSIAKIAEMAGVSSTTVSFVINGRTGVSSDTVKKVKEVIRTTGYVPRASASRDAHKNEIKGLKTRNIGILMPDGVLSTIPFYARLFESIHNELDGRRLNMSPIRCLPGSYSSVFNAIDLDGLILFNYVSEIAEHIRIPFVSVIGHPPFGEKLHADHIGPANERIGAMAARYLIEKGHKRILAINPACCEHIAMITRCRNFNYCANRSGVVSEQIDLPYQDRDKYGRINDGNDFENIRQFIADFILRKDRPTGIFVPCDSHMVVLMKSFSAAGVTPGADVEFIGCNNDAFIFDGLDPRPATIDVNSKIMAEATVEALVKRIGNPDKCYDTYKIIGIEPTLVKAGTGVMENWESVGEYRMDN